MPGVGFFRLDCPRQTCPAAITARTIAGAYLALEDHLDNYHGLVATFQEPSKKILADSEDSISSTGGNLSQVEDPDWSEEYAVNRKLFGPHKPDPTEPTMPDIGQVFETVSKQVEFADAFKSDGMAYTPGMDERIVTDPTTGGMKGQKDVQLHALPWEALQQLGRIYEYGSRKYEDYNFRKGYAWSLSFDALLRHLFAFWSGEDNDPESGLPHTAHAAWHALTLSLFSEAGKGTDDRPTV